MATLTKALQRGFRTVAVLLVTFAPSGPTIDGAGSRSQQAEEHSTGLFDPDPSHIWNRVHRCLLVRTSVEDKKYGEETLDPLLWQDTKHLLAGESHRRALNCLDEFLRTHAERQVEDAIRRAILLRDLWAVFDWLARDRSDFAAQRRELQVRLAEVLRRLAPTPEQLANLPDNYAEAVRVGMFAPNYDTAEPRRPFLPPDLFDPHGPWVCFTLRGYGPVALLHVGAFGARSRFLVFLRLPGGRAATLGYLRTLWAFPQPLLMNGLSNPETPQFPTGTMVAFARQMNLFDAKGKLIATPILESLQLRVYRAVVAGTGVTNAQNGRDQDFFEFRLDRRTLFSGKPGLVAIGDDDKEFPVFGSHGRDEFETPSGYPPPKILGSCPACHIGSGIHSVQSREQIVRVRQHAAADVLDDPHFGPVYWETEETLGMKQARYDWGLLNGYWQAKQQR